MLKYSNYEVVFAEIPDEITLAINLTNCPYSCPYCHSPWLREDKGVTLTYTELMSLIRQNTGISCVCFMGGSREPNELSRLTKLIKEDTDLKVAWYSGDNFDVNDPNATVDIKYFDYIKLGPYIEELGPLTSKTTNQRMYKNTGLSDQLIGWEDITHKFQHDTTTN